jgi:predicted secreted hydrolase
VRGRALASARGAVAAAIVAALLAGCSGSPILANPPLDYETPVDPSAPPPRAADPIAIELPRDDGPHDRLTEWWYYTGHLRTGAGRRFGFEAVVFRAERGSVPPSWAAHLALTDEEAGRFTYAQRSEIGPGPDRSFRDAEGIPSGFDLQVGGLSPELVAAGAPVFGPAWRLTGASGNNRIQAELTPEEAAAAGRSFGLDLQFNATKPPALHDGDGFVDFGPAGSSYYYSRTRQVGLGELRLDDQTMTVDVLAWFDHQWGDFISVGGGWDWFAVNLDDNTDITLSVVRDTAGAPALGYGTIVGPDGVARHLAPEDFDIRALDSWTSDVSGHTYPVHWSVAVPGEGLEIELTATVQDQELDTRATTGVAYWEGSQVVRATRNGATVGGDAYVEVTRYGG